METNNQRICNELLPVSSKSKELVQHLASENRRMQDLLARVQVYFADQVKGKTMLVQLTQAMQEVRSADCELAQLEKAIIEYVHILTD